MKIPEILLPDVRSSGGPDMQDFSEWVGEWNVCCHSLGQPVRCPGGIILLPITDEELCSKPTISENRVSKIPKVLHLLMNITSPTFQNRYFNQ